MADFTPSQFDAYHGLSVGDYFVALAAYREAVKRWPHDKITLRNRARVIEKSWKD